MRQFVGRARELAAIREELQRQRPSLIVVYGRRRVGKSTLLAEATRTDPTIYYQATEVVSSVNLELLKKQIARFLDEPDPVFEGIDRWEPLLSFVVELSARKPDGLTLVLDEFPYICDTTEGLPSIVQKVFDRAVSKNRALNLVLCGSQIAFMEELLGEKNPLRGRQTLELNLEPMPFREAVEFMPNWSPQQQLSAYGIFGGMPYDLQLCDPERCLRANVIDVIFATGAPLSNEVSNVLQGELTAPARYATILQAIGTGCTTTGDILGRTREISDARALTPYIKKLEALRLIRITRSLDASPKSRNRRYYLADPFLVFWYRFGLPNSSALATGHAEAVYDEVVQPRFAEHMGEIWEWIARQYIPRYGTEVLGSAAQESGKIWGADFDIDVAAMLLDGTVVFGECKWWAGPVGENVLYQLQEDAEKTDYGKGDDTVHWMLFSKSGFTEKLRERAEISEALYLLEPGDVCPGSGE